MITCPNCGTQNDGVARFCSECGADLRSLRSSGPGASVPPSPPPSTPTQQFYGSTQSQSSTDGWQTASSIEPPRKGRRTWLWVVIGILALCLAICCGFGIWANSGGEETVNGWLTQISDELTEVAPTPTPLR